DRPQLRPFPTRRSSDLNVPNAEDLVWLTLAQLEKAHLLAEDVVKQARRRVLPRREFLKLGITAALLPLVHSIVAPAPVEAQSPRSEEHTSELQSPCNLV